MRLLREAQNRTAAAPADPQLHGRVELDVGPRSPDPARPYCGLVVLVVMGVLVVVVIALARGWAPWP